MKKLLTMLMVVILIIGMISSCALAKVRIAMVVKNLGNAFFEACRDGGLEAIGLGEDIELIGYKGEIAILSATAQHTNQNLWIGWMKEELKEPVYKDMELVAVVYGDDLSDKSYREAMGLFKSYPNLKGIISPTTVGIAATGKALEDKGLSGVIALTGLGLPSEMKQYILNGTCTKMALWNPIELGYSAVTIAYKLVTGEIKGEVGEVMKVGKMGDIVILEGGISIMSPPYVFDISNIEKFAEIY